MINADGTLVTTADALKAEGTYNIVVTATGYNKTLEFTYTNKSDTTATKAIRCYSSNKSLQLQQQQQKPAVKTSQKKSKQFKKTEQQKVKKQGKEKKLTVTWKKRQKTYLDTRLRSQLKKKLQKVQKTYTVKILQDI